MATRAADRVVDTGPELGFFARYLTLWVIACIVVGIGLLALGALWLTARARYVRALRALHAGRPVPGDGLLLLGTAAFCMLLAAGTLTDLLV